MSNDILCAPIRLMAIHSGKYEFAEVLLDAPLHLMGPNNIGKTSLIAMLQFLYLDDQRQMHFSHSLAETRRYYFPHVNSYILFECRTPEGFRVVAVHGLGPARQYEFERFTYRGRIELETYLNADRCIRSPDDIKAQLTDKGFVKLEPRHLRAALSGVGDDRDIRLGLIPLRDRSQYNRFRFLFCNLLRLAQLRQDELKTLLIEIYRNEFQQMTVDLALEYRERFERVKRDAQAIQELRWIEKDVRRLFDLVAERDAIRGQLPLLWMTLGRLFTAQEMACREQELKNREEREQLKVEETAVLEEQRGLAEQRDERVDQRGALRARLDDFKAEEKEFADFVADWAQQRLHDLDREFGSIQARLGSLEGEHPAQIEQRLKTLQHNRDKTWHLLNSTEKLLLTRLRDTFDDAELAPLFRLLNPALLTLSQDAVTLHNQEAVWAQLKHLIAHCREQAYQDEALDMDLSTIEAPDLARMTDQETLHQTLEELERCIQKEQTLLQSAADRAGLEDRLAHLRTEQRDLDIQLARWQDLQKKSKEADVWQSDIRRLDAETLALRAQLDTLSSKIQSFEKQRQHLTDNIKTAESHRLELLERQRKLHPPSEQWPQHDTPEPLPDTFDDLYECYRQSYSRERQLTEETELLMNVVQDRTYEKYRAKTEADTLHRLADAVEALGNKEAALHKAWTDMAVGLRSSFAALSHDLDRLQGKVTELNRRMGKVEISNLESVRLIVSEHAEWTKRIRTVCDLQDDLPLFGQHAETSAEMKELGHLLEQTQSVNLSDLFDLHFEIESTDKKTRTYTNLDKIESNGTTITIKVLVHLILLRDLMSGGRARIPFYLDEVSSLDHDNIAGIIHQATTLDFVPVLASPDSVEEVQRIYMLSENNEGRIVLDEHAMIELTHDHETD